MKRLFNYRLFLILLLVAGGFSVVQAQEFRVPGNSSRWIDTGIDVANGTQIQIAATGRVSVGARGEFGPEGTSSFPEDRRLSFPTDLQPMYGLAVRLTASRTNPDDEIRQDYSQPPNGAICFSSPGHLWLIVNDYDHSDNTGEFVVNIALGRCAATDTSVRETRIHVADGQGASVRDAEVFVNGRRVGTTDINGILRLPRLNVGDRIVARSLVTESRTYRGNHQRGSTQDWSYRVYLTTARIGNDGSRTDFVVSNPVETQELRTNQANALIGVHLLVSTEWDASRVELENIRDRMLIPMSQFLYNATDGQFFVEQIELVDDATFWDDTDMRIHANLEVRPNVNLRRGGFLHTGPGTWMNMRRGPTLMLDSWFSDITAAHEFGHYGFDLGDEYSDTDGTIFCTPNLGSSGGQFGNNQPRAACMMFSQFQAGKLCSGRDENRHRTGTGQGDENCWIHLANEYRDRNALLRTRWFISTPDTRGAIPGMLPPLLGDWQPRVTIDNRTVPSLCQPITVVVSNADTREPLNDVDVWVRTPSGQNILQGKSGSYYSGGGSSRTSFGDGNVPITGVHVGDRVTADGGEYVITRADCSTTARLDEKKPIEKNDSGWFMSLASYSSSSSAIFGDGYSQQRTVQLLVPPDSFALRASLELTADGQIQVRVRADAQLQVLPQIVVTRQGAKTADTQKITTTFDEVSKTYVAAIGKQPTDVAYLNVEVSASADGKSFVKRNFNAVVSPLNANDETELFSADGQLSATIPAGAFSPDTRLSVSPSSIAPPTLDTGYVLVSGGYNIAASTGKQMKREGVIRFQLPNRRGERAVAGFNAKTFQILRYNAQNQKWESVGGTFLPEVDVISLRTNQLGDYAVVVRALSDDKGSVVSNKQTSDEKKSSSSGAFAVTDAVLKAESTENSGKCPVLVKFIGYITTTGPGPVKYTFRRSDGATAPVFTLEFKEAGTQYVTTSWTLGDAKALPTYDGWQAIKILSPNDLESSHETGRFSVVCQGLK